LRPDLLVDGVAAEIYWRSLGHGPRMTSAARVVPYMMWSSRGAVPRYYRWQEYPYQDYEDYGAMTVIDPQI